MGNGCKKVFKTVRNQFRDLAEEAVREPATRTLKESDAVHESSTAEIDGSVEPPVEQLLTPEHDGTVVARIDPRQIEQYASYLTEEVVGDPSKGHGLARLLPDVPESGSVDPALSTAIHEVARSHAKVVTEGLPHDLGLDPDVVHNWFLNECKPASAAVDFKRFLTTQLQAKGHGPQAADWLYQQMLAAGSTCMTALALDEGRPGLCRQYGHAAMQEITANASTFSSPEKATALINGWKQDALANQQTAKDNQAVLALLRQLERQERGSIGHGTQVRQKRQVRHQLSHRESSPESRKAPHKRNNLEGARALDFSDNVSTRNLRRNTATDIGPGDLHTKTDGVALHALAGLADKGQAANWRAKETAIFINAISRSFGQVPGQFQTTSWNKEACEEADAFVQAAVLLCTEVDQPAAESGKPGESTPAPSQQSKVKKRRLKPNLRWGGSKFSSVQKGTAGMNPEARQPDVKPVVTTADPTAETFSRSIQAATRDAFEAQQDQFNALSGANGSTTDQ